MSGRRPARMGDLIRAELAELLGRKVKDPRIKMVTVTEVDLSPDLRNAKVYISVLGDEADWQSSLAGLAAARGYLKRELGTRLTLRYVPELIFKPDRSQQHADRIEALLKQAGL